MVRSLLDDADDAVVAGRAADGDVLAFTILVRRYGPLLRGYARQITVDVAEADDAVQQAFITAWQQLPTLADPAAVKPWLMRIVSRKCLDRVRSRKPDPSVDENLPSATFHGSDPALIVETRSMHDALASLLATLPDNQRRCWLMKEVAHYSYDDIASELDLPASTVRGLLARARRTLIREMEPWR